MVSQVPIEFHGAPQAGLVSVVVPCFNAERFIAETLESALHQTYSEIEIIVIDDGSTDNSARIIQSYRDRIKIQLGPNRGASVARNLGTALARGEFIQYLDADDLLTPTSVEQRINVMQNGGADVAYSDWDRLVEVEPGLFEVREQIVRRMEEVHEDPEIAVITDFWAPPAALTYRRSIVDKIGGWKEWLPVIQDARFLQDAAMVGGSFAYSAGVGAKYRVHWGPSLSRRSEFHFVLDVFRNACDLQARFEARGAMDADHRRALAGIYDYAARSLFFHDRTAFRDCVARLYEVEPHFRLSWPKTARLASAMVGFEAAEKVLSTLKALRRVASRKTQRTEIQ